MPEIDEGLLRTLQEMGPAAVRADLERGGRIGARNTTNAWHWLYDIEDRQRRALEEEHRGQAERSIRASERAAAASEQAARASEKAVEHAEHSARWTFWATIVALATVAASVTPGFLRWLFR